MTTQKVTLVIDSADASGALFTRGSVRILPSFARLGDPADMVLIEQAPARAVFDGCGAPAVQLFPCDLIGPQGDSGPGWSYTVYYDGCPGNLQPWSFILLSTNSDESNQQRLSSYASTPAAQPGGVYLLVTGTPAAGDGPVYQDDGSVQWEPGGSGGGSGTVTSVSVASANGMAGTVANPSTTPAITLKTTANGVLKGNSTTGVISAAAAGTDYLAPAGSGAALTGITAAQVGAASTGALADEIARAEAAEALLAPLASPVFTGTVTVPTTVNATDAAQKAYVDSVAQGLDSKPSAAVVATSNLTLSGTQTIDGVAVTAGMRVLATGQSTASQNGLWTVASGSWTRPADFASGSTQLGAFAFIEGGTAGGSSGWTLTGTSAVTVDTSSQTWTQFSGAGEINAGTGLSKTGNTLANTGVLSAAAADTSVVAGGTASAPTFRTGTLDVIAAQHPPGADWSNNSHKITSVANGSAAQDAAAFGQIPTALPPNGSAGGSLSGTYPNPSIASSASLPGSPTTTTQTAADNSTKVATTAYADNSATTAASGKVSKNGDTMTGHLAPAVVTLTDASTVTVNAASGNDYRLLTTSGIGSTRAIGAPSNPVDGQVLSIDIQQDASGSRVVTWTSGAGGYSFGTDGSPTLSTAANAVDTIGFRYHGGLSKWICLGWKLGFS